MILQQMIGLGLKEVAEEKVVANIQHKCRTQKQALLKKNARIKLEK